MPARLTVRPPVLLGILVASITLTTPVRADDPSSTAMPMVVSSSGHDPDLVAAKTAERQLHWEQALELYLKIHLSGRQSLAVRERIQVCLQHVNQAQRFRDQTFRDYVRALSAADALNLYHEVLETLQRSHVDRENSIPARLFAQGVANFSLALADERFRQDYLPNATSVAILQFQRELETHWQSLPIASASEARTSAADLVRVCQKKLKVASASVVVLELLSGACSTLDEFTQYHPPRPESAETHDILESYGIQTIVRSGTIVVEKITPNSWASHLTTLTTGDRIHTLNQVRLTGERPQQLREALRQPIDGMHELNINREPAANVIRLPIPAPTIIQTELRNPVDGVGYLRILKFTDRTLTEFDHAIFQLKERDFRAVVVDLRGNAGGQFRSGVRLAERFLASGVIVTTQGPAPEFAQRVFSSDSGSSAIDVPVVLLVDGRTMSAAEVFAGALKDHRRAVLIGMPTFGKGLVQSTVRLSAIDVPAMNTTPAKSSGTLVLSVAKLFSPRGVSLNGLGIQPDILEPDQSQQLNLALGRAAAMANGMR